MRRHIGAFGGDVDQITVGGESAGAVATCLFAFSPLTAGLYRRLVMESGECTGPWGPTAEEPAMADSEAFLASLNATSLRDLQARPTARRDADAAAGGS